jgi:hypothetical protein
MVREKSMTEIARCHDDLINSKIDLGQCDDQWTGKRYDFIRE